jgi:hypothetical protein
VGTAAAATAVGTAAAATPAPAAPPLDGAVFRCHSVCEPWLSGSDSLYE